MPVVAITLSDTLAEFVESRVGKDSFATVDDYLADLIQRDRVLQAEHKFTALIAEGLASGRCVPFDRNFRKPE